MGGEARHPLDTPKRKSYQLTTVERDALRADYHAAIAANDGKLPRGWLAQRAAAIGVHKNTVWNYAQRFQDETPPKREPAPKRESVPDYVAGERPELEHTETPACWCRKKPASRDNVWCKLRTLQKPAEKHAALRTPEPRAERFKVRRVEGTRY